MKQQIPQDHGALFRGISDEERLAMRKCFGVVERSFRPDEVVYDFADARRLIGIVHSGEACVERTDEKGVRTILERLGAGGVFGEMMMFENVTGDSIRVVCLTPCRVYFMRDADLTRRCENACEYHSRLVQNMFALVADKAQQLSERVEVLSRRSIREKLLCYFTLQRARERSDTFTLPFSLSALADYISTDRSAMMRELKKMRAEGLVAVTGRTVRVPA